MESTLDYIFPLFLLCLITFFFFLLFWYFPLHNWDFCLWIYSLKGQTTGLYIYIYIYIYGFMFGFKKWMHIYDLEKYYLFCSISLCSSFDLLQFNWQFLCQWHKCFIFLKEHNLLAVASFLFKEKLQNFILNVDFSYNFSFCKSCSWFSQ